MTGAERRAFQAAMTLKYCQGNARLAERVLGCGRETVQLGLNEYRTCIICWGMQSAYGGDKLWMKSILRRHKPSEHWLKRT